jgi:hypothetical protein
VDVGGGVGEEDGAGGGVGEEDGAGGGVGEEDGAGGGVGEEDGAGGGEQNMPNGSDMFFFIRSFTQGIGGRALKIFEA